MIRILFVCHGNICRSPMAEFIMKDLIKKANLQDKIYVESCATSTEEIGNDIAFMKAKLNANIKKHNILCRIYNEYLNVKDLLDTELFIIDQYIRDDLYRLRKYNPEYLKNIEEKLGV